MSLFFYRFCCTLYWCFSIVWHPFKVVGKENLPTEGAFLLYANHQSAQDPMALSTYLPRIIHFMTKKELFDMKVVKPLVTWLGAFPVARGGNDLGAIRTAMDYLKKGEAVGIFPEGHRFTDGEIHAARNGVSMLALRTNTPVVPVRIVGDYRAFHRMSIVVGKPIMLGEPGAKCDSAAISAATETAMAALRELAK